MAIRNGVAKNNTLTSIQYPTKDIERIFKDLPDARHSNMRKILYGDYLRTHSLVTTAYAHSHSHEHIRAHMHSHTHLDSVPTKDIERILTRPTSEFAKFFMVITYAHTRSHHYWPSLHTRIYDDSIRTFTCTHATEPMVK